MQFRPAIRELVNLIIGIIGPSGAGKTYSAMRLASGIVGKDAKFAIIDTEARRSLHYADMFNFDILEMSAPFSPSAYIEAIQAADKEKYKVTIVDSMSHEWTGEGGVLDWQEKELIRMAGNDFAKRERVKMASWIAPKTAHKRMVSQLLQINTILILCFRAEEKIAMEKDPKTNKAVIVPKGWQPICSKELPYEMTLSFMLIPEAPGIPLPIKLQEQHKAFFPLNAPVDEEAGRKIAEWASGGVAVSKHGVSHKEKGTPKETNMATAAQTKMVFAKMSSAKIEDKKNFCSNITKKESSSEWTKDDINKLVEAIDKIETLEEKLKPKDEETIFCRDNNKNIETSFCNDPFKSGCGLRGGCPDWEEREGGADEVDLS